MDKGAKEKADCNACEKPQVMEGNEEVVEIYRFHPFHAFGDGSLIDIRAVEFLMDVIKVEKKDRADILRRLLHYHEELHPKTFGKGK